MVKTDCFSGGFQVLLPLILRLTRRMISQYRTIDVQP